MVERQQIPLDVNAVLSNFAVENARQTQRAIIAETEVAARDAVIDSLAEEVASLREKLEAQEALLQAEKTPAPSRDGEEGS